MTIHTELAAAQWRKSALSQDNSACVEIAFAGSLVCIRDSKYRRDPRNKLDEQPIISLPLSEWQPFLDAAASGAPRSGELQINHHSDGGVTLHDHGGVALIYTEGEWTAFLAAIARNDFVAVEYV